MPDDIKTIAVPVLAHRLILDTETYLDNRSKEQILEELIASVKVPLEG